MCRIFRTVSYDIVQWDSVLDSLRALGLKVVVLQAKLWWWAWTLFLQTKIQHASVLVLLILKTSAVLQLVVCPECFMCEVKDSAWFQARKISPFCKDLRGSSHSPYWVFKNFTCKYCIKSVTVWIWLEHHYYCIVFLLHGSSFPSFV